MNPLSLLNLFGGIPALLTAAVKYVQHEAGGKVDAFADRISTVSEHDHRAACARLGIKDEATIKEGLAVGRIAGDKLGDYEAWFVKHVNPVH